jgi:glycosyltransferase involved in cell wall biosynthesis
MTNKKAMISISVIVPLYNEAEGIKDFVADLISVLSKVTPEFEIICIDDGSTDGTRDLLKSAMRLDPRIKLLAFSRNFGKEAALTAGLDLASKDVVIPIDADFQDPPKLIPAMIAKWQEGYDVVLAHRRSRNDSFMKNLCSKLYHKLLFWISNQNIPADVGDYRLMDRKVVDAIKQMPEKTRYMKGIFAWVGFRKAVIEYDRPNRKCGESKLKYYHLFKLALDGIFSFSTKPLKIWLYIGAMFSLFAFFYAILLVLRTVIFGVSVPGYASIMVSILFIGGIQLVSLGIIGEYIARIYKETKNRPIYIVSEQHGFKEEKVSSSTKRQSRCA